MVLLSEWIWSLLGSQIDILCLYIYHSRFSILFFSSNSSHLSLALHSNPYYICTWKLPVKSFWHILLDGFDINLLSGNSNVYSALKYVMQWWITKLTRSNSDIFLFMHDRLRQKVKPLTLQFFSVCTSIYDLYYVSLQYLFFITKFRLSSWSYNIHIYFCIC